jgi:hypothetical protein
MKFDPGIPFAPGADHSIESAAPKHRRAPAGSFPLSFRGGPFESRRDGHRRRVRHQLGAFVVTTLDPSDIATEII